MKFTEDLIIIIIAVKLISQFYFVDFFIISFRLFTFLFALTILKLEIEHFLMLPNLFYNNFLTINYSRNHFN